MAMRRLNYILIKNINYILEKKTNQNKLKSKIIQEKTQEELKKKCTTDWNWNRKNRAKCSRWYFEQYIRPLSWW